MREQLLARISYEAGYNDSAVEVDQGNYLLSPSKNLIYFGDQRLRAVKGFSTLSAGGTGGPRMFPFGAGYATLTGSTAEGSVYAGPSLSLFCIGGSTSTRVNGTDITLAASTTLSFRLFSGGVYTGTTFTSGLAAPSACTLAVKAGGVVGNLVGAISIKVTRVRNSTGAESNASDASNVITFNSEQGVLTFNSTTTNGSDRWRLYVTPAGFGKTGPSYFWKEIAETDLVVIDGFARSYQVNFADADLQARLAPIDYNVPPVGIWAFQLESVQAVVGCYGDSSSGISTTNPGNVIAVSKVNKPEAYPADYLIQLPGAPTGVIQRASDAFVFVFGKSFLGVCSFTGGTPPLAYRTLWAGTGFVAPHNACVAAGGTLYGFSSQRGPIRLLPSSDEGADTTFAARVLKTTEGWTAANVVVGWDSDHQKVVYMHGSTLIGFNPGIPGEPWDAPIDISGSPISITGSAVAAATNGTALAFTVNNAGSYTPYGFNNGSTGSIWESYSSWRGNENQRTLTSWLSVFRHDDATTNKDVTGKIYKNFSTASSLKTVTTTTTATGAQEMTPAKINVRNVKRFAVYRTGRSLAAGSGDSGPILDELWGVENLVRK